MNTSREYEQNQFTQSTLTIGKSRLSPRQRSYEADLINRLPDNHQLNQAQQRIGGLSDKDRDLVSDRLSDHTRGRAA